MVDITPPRLLIMGFRKGLHKALSKRGLEYALWSDRPVPRKYQPELFLEEDFPHVAAELESKVLTWGKFTHVISCVESAVYPASLIRRPLKARLSKDSVILRCHDKLKMKQYLTQFEIPMTPFIASDEEVTNEQVLSRLGLPLVIKDRRLSGGRGMITAHSLEEFSSHRGDEQLFERFIRAGESSVESFVHNGKIQFQNITHYKKPGHINILPSQQELSEEEKILRLNEKILSSLGIQWGMSHVEVYNTQTGPLFGEIALRPPGGYLMELLEYSYGFNPWEAFLAVELGEEFSFHSKIQNYSASLILHPGEGYLTRVHGKEKVEDLTSLKSFSLKERKNFIPARKGVGEEIGHIILSHPDAHQLMSDVDTCERELRFELFPKAPKVEGPQSL